MGKHSMPAPVRNGLLAGVLVGVVVFFGLALGLDMPPATAGPIAAFAAIGSMVTVALLSVGGGR